MRHTDGGGGAAMGALPHPHTHEMPDVISPMSSRPVRGSIAACRVATRMSRSASSTSPGVTEVRRCMRACASASRIMDSRLRVVAVTVFRPPCAPSDRRFTYFSTTLSHASSVSTGATWDRAYDTYSENSELENRRSSESRSLTRPSSTSMPPRARLDAAAVSRRFTFISSRPVSSMNSPIRCSASRRSSSGFSESRTR